jgi:hypothetical protein
MYMTARGSAAGPMATNISRTELFELSRCGRSATKASRNRPGV